MDFVKSSSEFFGFLLFCADMSICETKKYMESFCTSMQYEGSNKKSVAT